MKRFLVSVTNKATIRLFGFNFCNYNSKNVSSSSFLSKQPTVTSVSVRRAASLESWFKEFKVSSRYFYKPFDLQ